ncbi:MAG: hypothetical protein E7497_03435 [Ruminococcus sp.]|nr:hypothetical protein [Ruminococcus sp.]
MKRPIRKLIAFSTAAAALISSALPVSAGYNAELVADISYDRLIQMRDKSILIENGTEENIGDDTELIVIDENGNKKVISKELGINGLYNYVSTTMGIYNYISPTSADYSFDFFDTDYRVSTETGTMIVGIDDKFALMNEDGEIVSEKYRNIYWITDGYYIADESLDNTFDSNSYWETGQVYDHNKAGLISSDGTVIVEPTEGIIGFYITTDGKNFVVDTETGDYFIDLKGNVVSDVYESIDYNTAAVNYRPHKYTIDYTLKSDIYYGINDGRMCLLGDDFKPATDYYDDIHSIIEYNYYSGTDIVMYDGFIVTLNEQEALIDTEGNIVIDFCDNINFISSYNDEVLSVDLWTVLNDGKLTVKSADLSKSADIELTPEYGTDISISYVYQSDSSGIYRMNVIETFDDGSAEDYNREILITDNYDYIDLSNYFSCTKLGNVYIAYRETIDDNFVIMDYNGNIIKEMNRKYGGVRAVHDDNYENIIAYEFYGQNYFSIYDTDFNPVAEMVDGYFCGSYYGGDYQDDITGDLVPQYGIFSLETGVVTDAIYDSLSYYNGVYIAEVDGVTVILSKTGETLYTLDNAYSFASVTPGSYYNMGMDARITFNRTDDATGDTTTKVYNIETNAIDFEQTGIYDYVGPFYYGFALVENHEETASDDLWTSSSISYGLIRIDGKEIIPCDSNNRFEICYGNLYFNGVTVPLNILNNEFSEEYGYNIAFRVSEDAYVIYVDGKWGMASPANKILLTAEYDEISVFTDGIARITKYDSLYNEYYNKYYSAYGLVAADGRILFEAVYSAGDLYWAGNGICYVRESVEDDMFRRYDFTDVKGTEVYNDFCKTYGYDLAKLEADDLYYVEKDGLAGIVKADNTEVIPVEYAEIFSFASSRYSLYYVQDRFDDVLTEEFTSKLRPTSDGGYLVSVKDVNGKIGVYKITVTEDENPTEPEEPTEPSTNPSEPEEPTEPSANPSEPEEPTEPSTKPSEDETPENLGDVDNSGAVDASDASMILATYAMLATGHDAELSAEQLDWADVNRDGAVDASDASVILAYYAYSATGGTKTLIEYLNL